MIIECPQCSFTGRVPDHATLAPHQARCPKCRFRFDIGDPDVQVPEHAVRPDLRHDLSRPRLDPSDSSYELDPIGDDSGFGDGSWEDAWRDDLDDARPPTAVNIAVPARFLGSRPADWALGAMRPFDWRMRLFQGWAVVFLVAATLITIRTAFAALTFDDARFFSGELLRPVAAVVLLVCAAALLCLSVDVSRRLARQSYTPAQVILPPPPPSTAAQANGNGNGMAASRSNGVRG